MVDNFTNSQKEKNTGPRPLPYPTFCETDLTEELETKGELAH